jgi:hypothetical protein
MRKIITLLAVGGLLIGSCGGGSDADTCEGIADQGMAVVQDMLDEIDDMSVEELLAGEEPAAITDLTAKMDELEVRADELGCSDEEMEELFTARLGNLTADSDYGRMMLELMLSEGVTLD